MDYINDDYKEEIEKLKKPKYKNKIEEINLRLNIYQNNINKIKQLNEEFLSLIEIKINENFQINFNNIYNEIIDSNLFEIRKHSIYVNFYFKRFIDM